MFALERLGYTLLDAQSQQVECLLALRVFLLTCARSLLCVIKRALFDWIHLAVFSLIFQIIPKERLQDRIRRTLRCQSNHHKRDNGEH